jgi:hypothetical protein
MSNGPGEWAVVYHGTKRANVKGIAENPLHAGDRELYGPGIYCSPNPAVAAGYTDCLTLPGDSRKVQYMYMFVCRVNVSKPHQCTQMPCPKADSPEYTVHMTICSDYWFANSKNEASQNIRAYGILVKEEV